MKVRSGSNGRGVCGGTFSELRMIRLQPFGNTGHGPVPRRRGDEPEQETGSPDDGRMIDDLSLRGSSRCRRMGNGYKVAMFTQPFHDFDTHNAFLSEGGAFAVVVGDFNQTPHQTWDNTDFPRPLRKSEVRLRLACPPSPGVTVCRPRGALVVRATPVF